MNRVSITNGDGKWFDMDTVKVFEEETFFNGSNHISLATGGQYEHETLYRTDTGAWILQTSSQWEGVHETYTEVTDADAAKWLMKNEYDDDDIPAELLPLLKDEIDALKL